MSERVDTLIIGGGVIGCAIAYELSKHDKNEIFLIERNSKIRGENQSSRNSGVIHAGIYYQKENEPLKAKFCVEGNRMLYDFCEEFRVPCKKTGKLVVATNPIEEEYLYYVLDHALHNEVPEFRRFNEEEIRDMEPNVNATSGVYFPTSGIIEPTELVCRLHSLAEVNGVFFVFGNKVINISPKENYFEISTQSGNTTETFDVQTLINAAGLYSDEIAKMVNPDSPYQANPVRGETAKFYKTRRPELSMRGVNVYSAPYGCYKKTGVKAEVTFKEFERMLYEKEIIKTVGIHLTPTFDIIDGEFEIGNTVTIGPAYTASTGKEDYTSGLHTEEHYLQNIKKFFPGIRLDDIELHQAGINAKLQNRSDFVVERDSKYPNCINLLGIDSPGLTSSLAIAKYIKELMKG